MEQCESRQCWIIQGLMSVGLFGALGGCGAGLANSTASLGGSVAGQRGTLGVLFINDTPYRAVLTCGSFDQTDPVSPPDIEQFGLADSAPALGGNTASDILSVRCARTFAIGSPRLLDLIERNLANADVDEGALVTGIAFFEAPAGEPDEGQAGDATTMQIQPPATRIGSAPPLEALLGVDFPCGALLIIRLETDGAEGFRVAFELIPSESPR